MNNFYIRSADTGDATAACEVMRRSITEVCAPDYDDDQDVISGWLSNKTKENVSNWIRSSRTYSVVGCNQQGEIVGFSAIALTGEILLNYLLPEALHKGLGKLMLEAMEREVISKGVEEIVVVSSITAKPFYERNGYVKNGEPVMVGNLEGDFPLVKKLSV
jgi:predicted N-acetyltransferase YhbS